MFPPGLAPFERVSLALTGGTVHVPLCRPRFRPYTEQAITHTFGGKSLLLVDGKPQFAEVAILRAFEADGWQGRWVETYPYRKNPRLWRAWNAQGPKTQLHVPIEEPWVNERLHAIATANGGYFSGCWDVLAWKGERLVFAESKWQKKDRIRGTQLRWVEAALRCGMNIEDFLLVEWRMV